MTPLKEGHGRVDAAAGAKCAAADPGGVATHGAVVEGQRADVVEAAATAAIPTIGAVTAIPARTGAVAAQRAVSDGEAAGVVHPAAILARSAASVRSFAVGDLEAIQHHGSAAVDVQDAVQLVAVYDAAVRARGVDGQVAGGAVVLARADFGAIMTLVVGHCLEAGLVANELTSFDMMGVEASGRAWTPYERAVLLTGALLRYLALSEQDKAPDAPLPEALRQLASEVAIEVLGNKRLTKDAKAAGRVLASIERWQRRQAESGGQALWEMALEEAVPILLAEENQEGEEAALSLPPEPEAQRGWLKKAAQRLKDLLPHARGDLDARVRWTSRVSLLCGYWLGFLVDSLKGVITAVCSLIWRSPTPPAGPRWGRRTRSTTPLHQEWGSAPSRVGLLPPCDDLLRKPATAPDHTSSAPVAGGCDNHSL